MNAFSEVLYCQSSTAHKTAQWRDNSWRTQNQKVQALQFEWAWQHPFESKAVREIFPRVKKTAIQGTQGKVRLLFEMLNLNPWCYYPLTVQLLSSSYTPLRSKCVPSPAHMPVTTAPMEALPVSVDADFDEGNPAEEADQAATLPPADSTMSQHDSTLEPATAQPASSDPGGGVAAGDAVDPPCVTGKLCSVCGAKADAKWLICGCGARSHIECMAKRFLQEAGQLQGLPIEGTCPACSQQLLWADLLNGGQSVPWKQNRDKQPRKKKKKNASPKSSPGKLSPRSQTARAKGKAKGKSAASQISEEGSSDLVAPQSIAAGTTSTASPVKKSRGRPRKTAAAVATARSAATGAGSAAQQISDKAEDTTADSASYADKQCLPQGKSVSEKSPAKKPRGRPRKAAAAAAVVESPDSAPTLDPVLGDGAMFKHRQKQKAFDANAAESSHAGDVPHLPSLAQQSGQPSSSAIPAENRAQAGNAEACLQGNIECTSPGGKLSDLPLRERLDRIQQLLNQAGCTQTDILPNLSTLQKPNSCQQSDMNSKHDSWQQPEAMRSPHDCQVCSASQPIILSPSPQHADSWRQPRAMRSPRINSVASACLQTQMNPCQESGNSPPDSLDNKPMCLLSSSPTPLCRQWLSPVLPHTGPQRSAASPALSELTELISSVRTDMLAKPPSEFTALVSSMPSDLRMSFIEDMSVVDEAELDEAGLKTVEGREAHLYPAEGSLTAQYVSVSCCPSPGVQRVGSPQQGRKRSRSAPKARPSRHTAPSPSGEECIDMCEPSLDGKLRPSKAVQETESDILGVIVPYDTPLTKSKALSRLAALQVCSPMYAASPVPLRRRLQAHTSTAAAVESTSGVQTDTDVICIDC